MNILLMGYGQVGHHVDNEFSDITIYDKYKSPYNNQEILSKKYDVAVIAVPTEMQSDGTVNVSEVYNAIDSVNADAILIKSAIPVGTSEQLNDNVVVSPEFYGTTQHAVNSPGVVILGHTSAMVGQNAADKIVEMYSHVKSAYQRFIFVDRKTAELAKYMENCWIATKVTFCNEFADIAAQYGISYNELRECWLADERVSPSHTYVYPDKPYYDSHCLKKDIPGLITSCEKDNIDTPLMRAVDTINKHKRNE